MSINEAIEKDKQERLNKINQTLSKISDEDVRKQVEEDLMTTFNSTEYVVLDESKKKFMSQCEHTYQIDERLEGRVHRVCTKCGYGKYLVS